MRDNRRHILPMWAIVITFVLTMIAWAALVDAALPSELIEKVSEVFK